MIIQIKDLISELLKIPLPLNPLKVEKVFSKHGYSQLDFSQIPIDQIESIVEHMRQLATLYSATNYVFIDAKALSTHNRMQNTLKDLIIDNGKLEQEIVKLEEELRKNAAEIEADLKKLSPATMAFLLNTPPVDPKLPILEAKKEQIKQYYKKLQKICKESEQLEAKEQLLQLKAQINILLLELRRSNVICTDLHAKDSYQSNIHALTLQIQSAEKIKDELAKLRVSIAKYISADTSSTKIAAIQAIRAHNEERLKLMDFECDTFVLPSVGEITSNDYKISLKDAFENSPDKEALINNYTVEESGTIETALNWLWTTPRHPEENIDKEISEASKKYLQLLLEMDQLKLEDERLASQIAQLELLKPGDSNNLEQLNKLMQAVRVFCKNNSSVVQPVKLNSSALDYYLILLNSEDSIRKMPADIEKLRKLQDVDKQLKGLRVKHQLLAGDDPQIPSDVEIKKQKKELLNQIGTKAKLTEQLQFCELVLRKFAARDNTLAQRAQLLADQQNVKRSIEKIDSVALQRQIDQLTQSMSAHQKTIDDTMALIRALPPVDRISVANTTKTGDAAQAAVDRLSAITALIAGAQRPLATSDKPRSTEAVRQQSPERPIIATATATTAVAPDIAAKPAEAAPTASESNPGMATKAENVPAESPPLQQTAQPPVETAGVTTQPNPNLVSKLSEEIPVVNPMRLSPRNSKHASKNEQGVTNKPAEAATPEPAKPATNPPEDTNPILSRPRTLSTIKEEPDADLHEVHVQKIYDMHHKNLDLLSSQASDIQQWYNNVYDSITTYSIHASSDNRPSHLLRDILFELEQRKNIDIIRAYMRLCPNPKQDLNQLLALKQNQPLIDNPYNDSSELKNAHPELVPLYEHYIRLKEIHPVEAELLLQAVRILGKTKIASDSSNAKVSLTNIPSLSSDPRYDSLKRHRGFLKVWEVLEDFFRMIIGKIMGQAEHEYYKRPCFFNTTSAQLLEEAEMSHQEGMMSKILEA